MNSVSVAMRKFLHEFNKRYNVEKSILTVITDGYSHGADVLRQDDAEREDIKIKLVMSGDTNSQRDILDPYTNKTFILNNGNYYYRNDFGQTQNLLEWFSQTCNVTVTGYFIFSNKRDFMNTSEIIQGFYNKVTKIEIRLNDMKKTGCVINVIGLQQIILDIIFNIDVQGDDELDDELVDAQTKVESLLLSKETKNLKSTSRFLTNEFIKEIA